MVSIAYVILSCKPFLKTRAKWQQDTWLSKVPQDSYVFITGAIGSNEPNVVNINVADSHETCPRRYYQYIQQNDMSKYDWVTFIHDDTFIFHERLKKLLEGLEANKQQYIGSEVSWPVMYMCGGAGFVLSRKAYSALREYLLVTQSENVEFHNSSDVTMGLWLKNIDGLQRVNSKLFNSSTHTHGESSKMDVAISYHYVTEELFTMYDGIS
jgi:hypothetical protein